MIFQLSLSGHQHMGCTKQYRLPLIVIYSACRRCSPSKDFLRAGLCILFFRFIINPPFLSSSLSFLFHYQFLALISTFLLISFINSIMVTHSNIQAREFLSKLGDLCQTQIFAKIENIEVITKQLFHYAMVLFLCLNFTLNSHF